MNISSFEREIDVKLYFGLSLMLTYFLIFKNNKNIKFNICMNKECFDQLRSNYKNNYLEKQLNFLLNLCKYNNLTNVKIKNNNNELHPIFINTWNLDNIKLNLSDNFIPYKEIIYKNYIVINTKVSQQNFNNNELLELWNTELKYKLFNFLNSTNLKIILTGEKNMSNCLEYDIHRYFMIYDDIINNINSEKIIDLTSNNTEDLYEYDKIIKNLNILKQSLFNISIGYGGQAIIYSLLNNTIVFCKNDAFIFYLDLTNCNEVYDNYWTHNVDNFINKLEKLNNKLNIAC
jgi:hypothetical protein